MALAKLVLLLLTSAILTVYDQNVKTNEKHRHRKYKWNAISVQPMPENFDNFPPIYNSPIPPFHSPPIDVSLSSSPISSPPSSSTPSPPVDSKYIYNVVSSGAVGNGQTDDTKAFNDAWVSACKQSNRAALLVPDGYSFLVEPNTFLGPCLNSMIFQVDGNILAPQNPDSWSSDLKDGWLIFEKVDGLTFQGGGLINGQGEKWWSGDSEVKPVALRFYGCNNLTIQGYGGLKLRVQNSPQFHILIDNCDMVMIDSISIESPADSPNTDGIHIASQNVLVKNSDISNGDDCISMGSGTANILIDNINCANGHGISIGSLGEDDSAACVANVNVTNSILSKTTNGLRIKTWQGGSGSVSSITYQNIQMDTVLNPIIIDQFYCPHSTSCETENSNLQISGVTYNNIVGTYNTDKPPVNLNCSNSAPCVDITIAELNLSPATSDEPKEPSCANAYGKVVTGTVPLVSSCLRKGSLGNMEYLSKKINNCSA